MTDINLNTRDTITNEDVFSIRNLFNENLNEANTLHDQHLNHQYVKVLKTIGFNRTYVKAQGQYMWDVAGNRYLDLLSGYGVFNIGRNHPLLKDTISEVLDMDLANLVQFDCPLLCGILAEKVLAKVPSGLDKIFFCNSGTEAVEGAIKFSRAATRRTKILYCDKAFHGLSTGSVALNGSSVFKDGFGPLLPGCEMITFNDVQALEEKLKQKDFAAVIFEVIQGKGVNIATQEFVSEASRLCKKYGTLLIIDEVQTGFGRTGKYFAIEHYGVEPDILTMAKALSGGFVPVGAIAMKKWIYSSVFSSMPKAMVHSSTFSKNHLAMACGLATLHVIEKENLVEKSRVSGEKLLQLMKTFETKHEFVKEVRGKGLMIGVEFGSPKKFTLKTAWTMLDKADKGLFCQMILIPLFEKHRMLAQVAGNNSYVIKLIPSLTINDEDISSIANAFDQVIADAHRFPGAIWELASKLAGHAISSNRQTQSPELSN